MTRDSGRFLTGLAYHIPAHPYRSSFRSSFCYVLKINKFIMLFITFFLIFAAKSVFSSHYELKNYTFHNGIYEGILIASEDFLTISPLKFRLALSREPRFEIYPSDQNSRWRVPPSYYHYDSKIVDVGKYEVMIEKNPFSLKVTRNFDSFILLDLTLVEYQDQYIEFDLKLGYSTADDFIYGLGERTSPFRIVKNTDYTIFNKNYHVTYPGLNLYGSHPVFFQVNPTNGFTNGLFFLNSNAMDVHLGEHTMKYRTIGGIIDLFILPGVYPRDLLDHYFAIIGHPRMIPTWALGFHNCKYGYNSTEALRTVVSNYRKYQIPLEAIWSDIDYMDGYKTFTVDPVNYKGLKDFINTEVHQNYQKYVVIIDPGIKIEKGYKSYDDGMSKNVFIKDPVEDKPFVGRMFCGDSYFPDFEASNTADYWETQLKFLHDQVPFDAVWLDQNELSSFCNGFCSNFTENKYDNPPYIPGVEGNHQLYNLSISLSSRQELSVHYNTHNLYPYEESSATISALETIRSKRTFLVSRSSHAGSGQFGGHWLGDNNGTWEDLGESIPGLLSFNMFGMPLVGADVGGFYRDTPKELMIRWIQLGSFYPFMRDHAHKSVKHQELYSFDKQVREISVSMLSRRYALLPYMYTTFYQFHKYSFPAPASPLWTVLPLPGTGHKEFLEIDTQFMIGECILVSPVLQPMEPGHQESILRMYLSDDHRWYNWGGMEVLETGWVTVSVPLDEIMLHIKGGCAVPLHDPRYTVKETMETGLTFVCAFDDREACQGNLYVDDGEDLDSEQMMYGTLTAYTASNGNKRSDEEKMSPTTICVGKYTVLKLDKEAKANQFYKPINLRDIKLLGVGSGGIAEAHVFRGSSVTTHPVQRIEEVWWVSGVDLDLFGTDWNVVLCREKQKKGVKSVVLTVILSVVGSVTASVVLCCCMICCCVFIVFFFFAWRGSVAATHQKQKYRILGKHYEAVVDGVVEEDDEEVLKAGNEVEEEEDHSRNIIKNETTNNFDQVQEIEDLDDEGEEEIIQNSYESRLINRDDENQI